jgi:primosomal protein N' (replication factor Y)
LWGLFARRFGTAEKFFARHFVVNYCPLAFLTATGSNLTPDKLRPRNGRRWAGFATRICGVSWKYCGPSGSSAWADLPGSALLPFLFGRFRFAVGVIARVTLDMALGKEFDYLIPEELEDVVEVGTRVKVPFAQRQVLGCVTALLESSPHPISARSSKPSDANRTSLPKSWNWRAGWRLLLLPAGNRLEKRPARGRAQGKGRLARTTFRARAARAGNEAEIEQAPGEILEMVRAAKELPLQDLLRQANTTAQTLRRLEDKGLIHIAPQISERDPYAREIILPTQALALNAEQQRAVAEIIGASGRMRRGQTQAGFPPARRDRQRQDGSLFASHRPRLAAGRGAIVLVPEISLTPQTVERFKARFSAGATRTLVAVLHSHLSAGERHDEWHKIRQGRARIVIGARSAVFAPVDPLGLIIVDEEHEYSYKQEEAPRYHARDVAVVRGRMEGAVVVLGSATPSMESCFNARKGKYRLLEMPTRADDKKMPVVRVMDMRQAARQEKARRCFRRNSRRRSTNGWSARSRRCCF